MEKIVVTVGMTNRNYSTHVIIGDGIVVATEKTLEELKVQMKEAMAFHVDGLREDGDTVPDVFNNEYELVFLFDNIEKSLETL
jgi:hypothetical protein